MTRSWSHELDPTLGVVITFKKMLVPIGDGEQLNKDFFYFKIY